jgi:hypothetical protein
MKLVDHVVRTKLSRALGAAVSFDRFKASLLGGSLDVGELAIGGGNEGFPPLVQVRRALARVSLGRALKREIAVKSLTLERPVIRIVRDADGASNLPRRPRAGAPQEPADQDGEDAARWSFDCEQVLLVDGEIHVELRGRSPYRLDVTGVVGELRRTPQGDYDLTVIADAVATGDAIGLGEFNANGKIAGAADLSRLAAASIELQWNLGAVMRGRIALPSIESRLAKALIEGTLQTRTLLTLLPLPGLASVGPTTGQVEFRIEVSHRPDEGLRISEAIIRATGVSVPQLRVGP